MFEKLIEKTNTVTNSDIAKKVRFWLIIGGLIGAIVGIAMLLGGIGVFFTFTELDPSNIDTSSVFTRFGLVAGLEIVGGLLLAYGVSAVRAGLAIVVVGVTTQMVDDTPRCQKCGDPIGVNEKFCNKCGNNTIYACSNCGTKNNPKNNFCENCGTKLK